MSTLDDILRPNRGSNTPKAKGSLEEISKKNSWGADENKETTPTEKKDDETTSVEKKTDTTTTPVEKQTSTTTSTTPVYSGTESLYDWAKNSGWAEKNPSPELTAEQQKAQEKKERRDKVMASISDGISALSNLYFTTKGAPNMYSSSSSQSAVTGNRWDKLKREQEAERDKWYDRMQKMYTDDSTAKIRQRNAELAEAKDKRDADLSKAQINMYNERAAGYKADAQRKQAIADATAELEAAEIEYKNAKTKEAKANAEAKLKQAEAACIRAYRSGGSREEGYIWYDAEGNPHYAKTEGQAKLNAKDAGTYEDDYTDNIREQNGVTTKTHTRSGWHSEPSEKKENTSSGGNKNTSGKGKKQEKETKGFDASDLIL